MQEKQYYTPDIEDIRVGYECEIKSPSIYASYSYQCINKEILEASLRFLELDLLRTPYLTKEQIEAEGWLCNPEYNIFHKSIDSESGWSVALLKDNKIVIENTGECVFYGYCPSINEFRTITRKQLKIV